MNITTENCQSSLPRDFLERMELNKQVHVTIDVSFDEGNSYMQFPFIDITMLE